MKFLSTPHAPALTALIGAVIMVITPQPFAGFGSALALSSSGVWAYMQITQGDSPVSKVWGWVVATGITAVVVWRFYN